MKVRRHTATTNKQAVGYLLYTDLGYADDISLLADNPQHLQNMLSCFHEYCTEHGLSINPTKCEVVVFGRSNSWPRQSWQVAGMHCERTPAAQQEVHHNCTFSLNALWTSQLSGSTLVSLFHSSTARCSQCCISGNLPDACRSICLCVACAPRYQCRKCMCTFSPGLFVKYALWSSKYGSWGPYISLP